MNSNTTSVKHGAVFTVLTILAVSSVLVTLLHLSPALNNTLIFIIAFLMAGIVVSQYMGLKWEGGLIYWVFFIPVILFAILVVLLIPDVAHIPVPWKL